MKYFALLKDLIKEEKSYRAELDEVRDRVLKGMIYIFVLMGLPAVVLGAINAYDQGYYLFAWAYIIIYLVVPLSLLLSRYFSFKIRAVIPLALIFLFAVFVLRRIGLSGEGFELLFVFCIITAILYGIKAGLFAFALSLLVIIFFGAAFITGYFKIDPEIMLNSDKIISWATTFLVFIFVVTLLMLSPILLQNRLYRSLRDVRVHAEELERSNELLQRENREKELLLKEIHHRVKNNMQIISSLLSLQSNHITDENDRKVFVAMQNRIRSMAYIHEQLYGSQDLVNINIRLYVVSLVKQLEMSYSDSPERIRVIVNVDDIYFPLNIAMPCALLIHELVTNAYEHAFPGDMAGNITISIENKDATNFELTVSDTGTGFPDTGALDDTSTLGMHLIHALVNQLHGKMELSTHSGTAVTVTFPFEA